MQIRRTDWGERAGNRTATSGIMVAPAEARTLGWKATCQHAGEPVAATVLDPFVGSGTACLVAAKLGRASIGIDASRPYLEMAKARIGNRMAL